MVEKSIVTNVVQDIAVETANVVASAVPEGTKMYVTKVIVSTEDANPTTFKLGYGDSGSLDTSQLYLYAEASKVVQTEAKETGFLFSVPEGKYLVYTGTTAKGYATVQYYIE